MKTLIRGVASSSETHSFHGGMFFRALTLLAFAWTLCCPCCYTSEDTHGDGTTDLGEPDPGPELTNDWVLDIDLIYDPVWDDPIDQDPEPPDECLPSEEVQIGFTFDGDAWPENVQIELTCHIEDVVWDSPNNASIIELACWNDAGEQENHTIEIMTIPWAPVYFMTEESRWIFLTYRAETNGWSNRWLILRVEATGDPVVACADTSSLSPGGIDPIVWFSPWALTVVSGLCPPAPSECSLEERVALGLNEERYFFDHTMRWGGTYGMFSRFYVEQAVHHHEATCTDVPDSWYKFIVMPIYPPT